VRALQESGYEVEQASELLGLARSTYYYASRSRTQQQVEADIASVLGEYPTYGTRRVTHQLGREPYAYHFNRKRIQGIMRRKDWLRPVKRAKIRTTNSQHPYPRYSNLVKDLVVTRPDEVWVSDITYIRLGQGFVYLAIVLDVFTRVVRGWNLSVFIDQELSLGAVRMGLIHHQPQIHHSDQGIQYAAHAYTDLLKAHQIYISMAAVGKAEENGYAERFMRTIKEEEVDLSDYRDFADAQHQIGRFIQDVYNTKRIHSSLGYLTPLEFEAAWRSSQSGSGTP
jgi:transposase InsO family protein